MIKKIGKYDIVGLIARGGFSDVYLAMEPSLGVQLAIKVFAAEQTSVEGDSAWRQRFLQESKILHSLSSAPHVVRFMEFGFTQNQKPYIVMPYYKRTLADLLGEDNKLSQHHCVDIAKQVLRALQAIHKVGILHLDIKPSNILIDDHEQIHIADFGISELANEPRAQNGVNANEQTAKFGSQHFASPEQIAGLETLSVASDMYSLAAVLFRCFTGKHIDNNVDLNAIANEDPFLSLLATVADRDAKKRPQSATEFYALVQAFEDNQDLENRPSSALNDAKLDARTDEHATQLLSALRHDENDESNSLSELKHDIITVLRKQGHVSDFDFKRLSLIAKANLHEDFESFDLLEYIRVVRRQLTHNEPAFARFVLWLEQVDEQIEQQQRQKEQKEQGMDKPNPERSLVLPAEIRDNLLQLGLAVLPSRIESKTTKPDKASTITAYPHDMQFDKPSLDKLIEERLHVYHPNNRVSPDKCTTQAPKVRTRLFFVKNTYVRIGLVLFILFISALVPNLTEFGEDASNRSVDKAPVKIPKEGAPEASASDSTEIETRQEENQLARLFSVNFNVFPQDATVSFQAENGEMISPEQLSIGNYTVRISKNGYLTEKQNLVLDSRILPNKVVTISANLSLSNSRYFIGETDRSVADGTPLEFILLPKIDEGTERIRMMSFEVTNELYQRCIADDECTASTLLSDDPREPIFEQADHPAVNVSWFDITDKFIPWLSQQTNSTLRLPTEREWMHAAKAGQAVNRYSWGEQFSLDQAHCRDCYSIRWLADDYRFSTRPVMSFSANKWQLYDLHGNVQEWTGDCAGAASTSLQDRCDQAIVKGGSWFTNHLALSIQAKQVLQKNARSHTTGFRLVEVLEPHIQTGRKDEE